MKTRSTLLLIITLVLISFSSALNAQTDPIVNEDVVFEEIGGQAAVEAEFFYKQSLSGIRQWYMYSKDVWPKVGRDDDEPHCEGASNNSYLEVLPDTRVTHADQLTGGENFSNEPGKLAVLHYKVYFNTAGRYYVWVRAHSTGSEDNGIHVGIDGEWPATGQRMQWCTNKLSWHWESRQRTEEVHCGVPHLIYLDVDIKGEHEIMFSMREDGFEFDKFLLTTDIDFVPPANEGPEVKLKKGKLPKAFPVVEEDLAINSTTTDAAAGGTEEGHAQTASAKPVISGELKMWHKVTFTFDGPETSETDEFNPFMNYRFNVLFSHKTSGKEYLVPGYFAADGDAGNTSAEKGNKWRVQFAPDEEGVWEYAVDFRKGNFSAVSDKVNTGQSGAFMDQSKGSFEISATDKTGRDFRSKGMLQYVGERYLKFAGTGEYFLKVGSDAPENMLAYEEFDGSFKNDGHKDDLIKSWEAHEKHWTEGDPTWKDGMGKDIIGAVNYLASKGMNAFSFLTNNIEGDDRNVFMYIDYDTWDRMDCSKLDQWEVLFEHADHLGMFLHFKLTEAENQGLLDNGGVGANTKLYYRELIARFGHHLALNWNLCEENGEWGKQHTPPQSTRERLAMTSYFAEHDPYRHHLVIHNGMPFTDLLGPDSHLTGPSVQTNQADFSNVHSAVLKWVNASKEAGKQWAVACDEPGDAQHSLLPDAENPEHDNARMNGLWGTFMAGGWGTEWYFGYKHAHSDLTCEDYASRDLFWDQGKIALDFFSDNEIPFWDMESHDEMILNKDDYAFAKPGEIYVFLLKKGSAKVDLSSATGKMKVLWFNPRTGGKLQKGSVKTVSAGSEVDLGNPPKDDGKDWVVVVKK